MRVTFIFSVISLWLDVFHYGYKTAVSDRRDFEWKFQYSMVIVVIPSCKIQFLDIEVNSVKGNSHISYTFNISHSHTVSHDESVGSI